MESRRWIIVTAKQCRWQFSPLQVRILHALSCGLRLKSELRDELVGSRPTPNQQSILSRSTRILIDHGFVQKERLKMSLTPRGEKIHAMLKAQSAR